MLQGLLTALRAEGLPLGLGEWLVFLRLLQADGLEAGPDEPEGLDRLHLLGRLALVHDEAHFDRYDRAFGRFLDGVPAAALDPAVPAGWLTARALDALPAAMRETLDPQAHAEWVARLREGLRARLDAQQGRHEGGSRWVGTGGSSPYGQGGVAPTGVRLAAPGDGAGQGRALKVWQRGEHRESDPDAPLRGRALRGALLRLRRFAREGAAEELDLPATLDATARQAGLLDLRLRPARRNHLRVKLLIDVGGSMDEHIRPALELFEACREAFRELETLYFHNCVYERLWRGPLRRGSERLDTHDWLHGLGRDHKLILIGDATMAPHEITHPGGSVEHANAETGAQWLRRLLDRCPAHAWLNPVPATEWAWRPSIGLVQGLLRPAAMQPLTLAGLKAAVAGLGR